MTNPVHFTKMHGLGNDFVVVDATHIKNFQPQIFTTLSHRHTGIGFDQLLIIEPSKQADFFCRIYNADGSEAEQCGNGLRCVARYIHEQGMHSGKQFKIETRAGLFPVEIKDYDHIRVCMGAPRITSKSVNIDIKNPEMSLSLSILSLGNPHAILNMDSLSSSSLATLAAQISVDSHFPDGVNIGFMQVATPHTIHLRTFERGVGETFACGSNACAAAVSGIMQGLLQTPVDVNFRNGALMIEWEGEDQPIYMMGPATRVYSGEV